MRFDVEPQLAKLSHRLPGGRGWLYEPKWDGFRGLLVHLPAGVQLLSRRSRPLGRHYPELLDLGRRLPPDTAIDGEIVAFVDGGLDFGALQHRLAMDERRAREAGAGRPVSFVAFDVLRLAGEDLMQRPLKERRTQLERLLSEMEIPALHLTPQTDDPELASRWMEGFVAQGIEGVVAKRADGPYRPGQRDWIKVKSLRSVEAVVVGYIGHLDEPSLVLSLYGPDGTLYAFGSTYPLRRARSSPLEEVAGRGQETDSPIETRWGRRGGERWTELPPELVAEVQATHIDHGRLRHLARFLRWRPDRDPRSCTADQLGSRPSLSSKAEL
jgi:ATP-dependent DNA ligase